MSGGNSSAKDTLFAELQRVAAIDWSPESQSQLNRLLVQSLEPSFKADFATAEDLDQMESRINALLMALGNRLNDLQPVKPHIVNLPIALVILGLIIATWDVIRASMPTPARMAPLPVTQPFNQIPF